MKKIVLFMMFISMTANAADDIDVTIEWIQNVANSRVLEVCGNATSKSGKWPLVVSLTHGESKFSTITSRDGRYCQLLARQTNDGKVQVSATSMDGQAFGANSFPLK